MENYKCCINLPDGESITIKKFKNNVKFYFQVNFRNNPFQLALCLERKSIFENEGNVSFNFGLTSVSSRKNHERWAVVKTATIKRNVSKFPSSIGLGTDRSILLFRVRIGLKSVRINYFLFRIGSDLLKNTKVVPRIHQHLISNRRRFLRLAIVRQSTSSLRKGSLDIF